MKSASVTGQRRRTHEKERARISIGLLFLSMLAGLFALLATDAYARKPPKCTTCSQTITLPDGRVCTLVACGSDCVYQCPL